MVLKGKINSWSLEKKMTFIFTLTIFLISLLVLIVSTISQIYYMTQQSKEMVHVQLEELATNYDDTLEQYQNLAVGLVIDGSVQKYCKSDLEYGEEYDKEANEVYAYLLNLLNVQPNANFAVVEKKEPAKYVYKGRRSVQDAKFDIVYKKDYKESIPVKEGSAVHISFGNRYFRSGEYTLTLYHPIYSTTSINENTGMLIMNMNDSLTEQLHEEETKKKRMELFLLDCNGKIVSISNQMRIGQTINYMGEIEGDYGSFQKEGKLVSYQKVGKWNYYLVNETSLFEFYKDSIRVSIILISLVFCLTAAAIFVIKKMIRSFYEPMNRVIAAMDNVEANHLEERIELGKMDVDSKKLAEGFNLMMDKIDVLVEQIKEEQRQMEQIRFNALQAQIKPHFLYNTLECIHWQALSDGNREITIMVKALAQYYRICLSRGREVISLKQELEHIKSYLIIQNMRYDNIVELENLISQEYDMLQIPKMTLQPLVENAIYHGIRVKEGKVGKVTLSIRTENEEMYIFVKDSGTGMSIEKINEINRSISEFDESFGYGVRNVHKRIELLFGNRYGLRFLQNEQGEVIVEIHLPIKYMDSDS